MGTPTKRARPAWRLRRTVSVDCGPLAGTHRGYQYLEFDAIGYSWVDDYRQSTRIFDREYAERVRDDAAAVMPEGTEYKLIACR